MAENLLPFDSCDDKKAHGSTFTCEEILAEIEKQQSGKKNWVKNLFILLISLFIFFRLGLFKSGVSDLLIIIIVLLIHESGHFIGMRLFGYRNVQMFFIPFFGAAVSGQSRNVPAYKKAIVTLLGPVPGIFLGIVSAIAYSITKNPICRQLMIMFVVINTFNLLPFFPLDGGRFLHQVLFSRNRYIELCFTILASLALIGLGLLIQAWLLAVFGLFTLVGAQFPFKVASIANQLKPRLAADLAPAETLTSEANQTEKIPPEIAADIVEKIQQKFRARLTVKVVASYTKQVWERMHTHPPRILPTISLLGLYLLCFFFSFVAVVAAAGISLYDTDASLQTKVVEYEKPDGRTARKEQTYLFSKLSSETELAQDRPLYHGRAVWYSWDGAISQEGTWHEGKRDGEWKVYDPNGHLLSITAWNKGTFVVRREQQDGRWVKQALEDLPAGFQDLIRQHTEGPPCGPQTLQNVLGTTRAEESNSPPQKP